MVLVGSQHGQELTAATDRPGARVTGESLEGETGEVRGDGDEGPMDLRLLIAD